jgi:hypothetical protein
LSFVFLSVLGFKNAFRHRPVLPENFLDFFGLFLNFARAKSNFFDALKYFYMDSKSFILVHNLLNLSLLDFIKPEF